MKSIFEVRQDLAEPDLYYALCNNESELELQVIFKGSKSECNGIVDALQFCQAKGFFK